MTTSVMCNSPFSPFCLRVSLCIQQTVLFCRNCLIFLFWFFLAVTIDVIDRRCTRKVSCLMSTGQSRQTTKTSHFYSIFSQTESFMTSLRVVLKRLRGSAKLHSPSEDHCSTRSWLYLSPGWSEMRCANDLAEKT